MCLSETNVSGRKIGVLLCSIFKVLQAFLELCSALGVLQGKTPSQEALISRRDHRPSSREALALLTRYRHLHLSGDSLRNITLQREHVGQVTIVGFRPEVLVGCATNKLSDNANSSSLANHRTFD